MITPIESRAAVGEHAEHAAVTVFDSRIWERSAAVREGSLLQGETPDRLLLMVTDCLDRDAVIAGTVRSRAILRRAYVALVVRVAHQRDPFPFGAFDDRSRAGEPPRSLLNDLRRCGASQRDSRAQRPMS